jgi:hypothetical protein
MICKNYFLTDPHISRCCLDILTIITCQYPDTMTCHILPTNHLSLYGYNDLCFLLYRLEDTSKVQWLNYISTGQQDVCVGIAKQCIQPGVIWSAVWFIHNKSVHKDAVTASR